MIAITSPIAMRTKPRPRYGPITAPSWPARMAVSWAGVTLAMFTGSSNFGRMRVAASSTPMFVPTGLNACAKLSRRVAVSSGPERKHVRVGGRLENRAPGGDREQSDQERLVGHDLAGRIERDRARRCEKHTGEKAGLVAEPLD